MARYQFHPGRGIAYFSEKKGFIMTSYAAPFSAAAQEAANDSLPLVTPATSAIPSFSIRIRPFRHIIGRRIEPANDAFYDPTDQCEHIARMLLTEIIRLARTAHGKTVIRRHTIGEMHRKYRRLFARIPFWETFLREFRLSIRFEPYSGIGKEIVGSPFVALRGKQISFIAEECWTTILLGNADPKDTVRLLRARSSFIGLYRMKSDDWLLDKMARTGDTAKPWLFLAALSAMSERDIQATIIGFPHDE